MPIYEYRCENGHTIEVLQRMSDGPLSNCTACQAPVQRVFHPVAVHFKGSGFYSTDYAKKPAQAPDDGKVKAGSDASDSTDSPDGAKPDSKKGDSASKSGSGASEPKPSKSSKASTSSA